MSQHSLEARWTCLRRYTGLRLNLFRAMHDKRFVIASDKRVLAMRAGDYALTATVAYDSVFSYFYVKDCHWYRSDLAKLTDDDVPEQLRHELLRQFRAVLG